AKRLIRCLCTNHCSCVSTAMRLPTPLHEGASCHRCTEVQLGGCAPTPIPVAPIKGAVDQKRMGGLHRACGLVQRRPQPLHLAPRFVALALDLVGAAAVTHEAVALLRPSLAVVETEFEATYRAGHNPLGLN